MAGSVVRSVVRAGFGRPAGADVAAIGTLDPTAVSEAVGPMYTLDGAIRSLYSPAGAVCGVAFTVKCPAGDNLGVVRALGLVERGDVLVVDAQGFTAWCLGGFQLLRHARETRGLAGVVVNGGYRDVADARREGFPLYALGVSPFSGPKAGPAEIGVPVCCGGVVVHAGDVVAASEEGIAVVPRAYVPAVAARARAARPGPGGGIGAFVERLSAQFDRAMAEDPTDE